MHQQKQHGFTLIELLIVLAIISILSAIAYPSYIQHITKARRTEAQIALLDIASHMEHYYMENKHSYADATLTKLDIRSTTEHGFYNLAIVKPSATGYTLQAKPLGIQAQRDTACATLTLDALGQKGKTGTGTTIDCW